MRTATSVAIDTDALVDAVLAGVVRGIAARRQLVEHADEIEFLLERASAGDAYPHRQALGDALALALFANRRCASR